MSKRLSFERAWKDRFFRDFFFFFEIEFGKLKREKVSSDGKPTSWIGYCSCYRII